MHEGDDTESFEVVVRHETEKALLVVIGGEEYWVPKSQVSEDSEVYSRASAPGTLIVSRWWAEKEGLS